MSDGQLFCIFLSCYTVFQNHTTSAVAAKRESTEAETEVSPPVTVVVLPGADVTVVVEGPSVLEGA